MRAFPVQMHQCGHVVPSGARCGETVLSAGPHHLLAFIGWQIADDEHLLRCPDHHGQGERAVADQVSGAILFAQISERADPANANFDPDIHPQARRAGDAKTRCRTSSGGQESLMLNALLSPR